MGAASARCRAEGGLSALYDDYLVVVLPGSPQDVTEDLHRRLALAAGTPTTVAAAGPATSPLDLRHVYREATQCLKLMHQLGREQTWGTTAEFAIYSMLFTADSAEALHHFVSSTIGALLDYDERHSTELVATAAAYLESMGSPTAAAARLDIHANTVAQRISRIDRLLGARWRVSHDSSTSRRHCGSSC
ncbi:PucR family transcriptional regulator [Aeromicrobium sp. UC242_57]|uniref:PucR family transcriptional regulator n=1 Tax=Aeromicrobium sp. UC242_57 TaxID=3374624 RepID=UPI00379DE4D0